MSDGPPTEDKTVSAYLDYLALACVFGVVETAIAGKLLLTVVMLTASLIFHNAGIKWPRIKSKTATLLDWNLWGKRIAVAVRVLLVLTVLTLVITGYLVTRTLVGSDNKNRDEKQSVQALPSPLPSETIKRVDWHDKQNWRRNLHTGMTRKEVRQLFGEPERVSVVSTLEFWDYGLGHIDFDMDGHPDGSLQLWSEP